MIAHRIIRSARVKLLLRVRRWSVDAWRLLPEDSAVLHRQRVAKFGGKDFHFNLSILVHSEHLPRPASWLALPMIFVISC